jgi:hypothetical protein
MPKDPNIHPGVFPLPNDMRAPGLVSETVINRLWDGDLDVRKAAAAEVDRQLAMRPTLNAETLANGRRNEINLQKRAYDFKYDYHSAAPREQQVSVIDLNTYDGAPDSEGCSHFIGRGATMPEALDDLLEQFADYDADAEAAPDSIRTFGRIVNGGGGTQPDETEEIPYSDPDEDNGFDSDLDGSGNER